MASTQAPAKPTSAVMTLFPLTGAAVSTAAIMYPVDVMRAITMANAGTKGGFSLVHLSLLAIVIVQFLPSPFFSSTHIPLI